MSRSSLRPAVLVVAASLAVGACTRPENSAVDSAPEVSVSTAPIDLPTIPASTTTTTAPATTTPPTTTPPTTTTTTTPPTTTPPTTTTTTTPPTTTPQPPESPADLTLFFDGVLPFRFGVHDVDVVAGLAAVLGEPVTDDLAEYPTADQGVFVDESGEDEFIAPYGRTVCFANSLCVQFGAGAPETLIFTGWRIDDTAPSQLATEDGIMIGSILADHIDVITVDQAGRCFQTAFGAAAGIDVVLLSADEPFRSPAPDGDGFVDGDPDPAMVRVQAMSAGELPVSRLADC